MEHLVSASPPRNASVSRPPSSAPSNASDAGPAGVDVNRSLALCAMLLMDVLAVAGNLAVMIVICKSPHLRKFAFVFHLCSVDLLAALVLMPLGMAPDGLSADGALCRSYLCLSVCLLSAAILTICAINVERYYYIVHPMRHEVKMTLGVVALVLAGVWTKAVVMSSLPFLGWLLQGERGGGPAPPHCSLHWEGGGTARLLFMVFFAFLYFLCPLFIILLVYCNMFKVARVTATQRGPLATWTDAPRPRSESACSGGRRSAGRRGTFGGGKVAAILVVVGGQFVCCWLPYFSFHLYSAAAYASPASLARLENAVTWIGYFCFTSNPFFYGYLNRQIREELGRRLAGLFKRAGSGQGEQLPSREASIEENFLQFLQGTACNLELRNSHGRASRAETGREGPRESSAPWNTPADFHVPGQILEETSELVQRQILNNRPNVLH
ncbi:G-protein coupled receptor 61 [Stigmatopora argus]